MLSTLFLGFQEKLQIEKNLSEMLQLTSFVMHSNKTGNKSHRPFLRYGQLKLA